LDVAVAGSAGLKAAMISQPQLVLPWLLWTEELKVWRDRLLFSRCE